LLQLFGVLEGEGMKERLFVVSYQYPRSLGVGSVVRYRDEDIKITRIEKIAPVTEKTFMVIGYGEMVRSYI
jgi:hypothetical protein